MIASSFRKFTIRQQQTVLGKLKFSSVAAKESNSGFSLSAKNKVTALVLVSFVVGVYYVSIRKMSQTDELEDVIKTEVGKKSTSTTIVAK
jgi:hypothetical protein